MDGRTDGDGIGGVLGASFSTVTVTGNNHILPLTLSHSHSHSHSPTYTDTPTGCTMIANRGTHGGSMALSFTTATFANNYFTGGGVDISGGHVCSMCV